MTTEFNPDAYRAQIDQARAAIRDIAPAIAEFWKALVAAGMDANSATAVTCQWVAGLFTQQQGKP